ncbi:MAG: hypothetical protein VW257_04635 [Quisquiliibacterium sp.]
MQWFRMYNEILNDPKVDKLDGATFKGWVKLLALASSNEGLLPSLDDTSYALRLSVESTRELIDTLVMAGLLDIRPDKKIEPHNWPTRQYKSDNSTERVRKHRAKQRNVSETPPDTDTDTDTDTEKYNPPTPKAGEGASAPKVSRKDALEAFEAYNALALELGLPQAAKFTPDRERKIKARLKLYGIDGWQAALENIRKSDFLQGKTDHGYRANLDFLCRPTAFNKLHDGGYSKAEIPKTNGSGLTRLQRLERQARGYA